MRKSRGLAPPEARLSIALGRAAFQLNVSIVKERHALPLTIESISISSARLIAQELAR